MRGLVLNEQTIGILEKIQLVVDHSSEFLNRPRSVDEKNVTNSTIHLFIEISHLRFLLIVPAIRNFRTTRSNYTEIPDSSNHA